MHTCPGITARRGAAVAGGARDHTRHPAPAHPHRPRGGGCVRRCRPAVLAWWRLGTLIHGRGRLGIAGDEELPEGATPSARELAFTFACWAAPLIIAAPLFSRDIYSYIAQGAMTVQGIDSYTFGPAILGAPLALDVPAIWLYTPAPYGPVFLTLAAQVSTITEDSTILGILGMRILAYLGIALLLWAVPRIARASKRQPRRGAVARRAQPARGPASGRRRPQRRGHARSDGGRPGPGGRQATAPGLWCRADHAGRPDQGARRTSADLPRADLGRPGEGSRHLAAGQCLHQRHRDRRGDCHHLPGRDGVRLGGRPRHPGHRPHLDLDRHRPRLLDRSGCRCHRHRHHGPGAVVVARGRAAGRGGHLPVHAAQAGPVRADRRSRRRHERGGRTGPGHAPLVSAVGDPAAGGGQP